MSDQSGTAGAQPGTPNRNLEIASICEEPIPDLLVDGIQGVTVHAGTVRLNMYVNRFDPLRNRVNRVVVTRLVIPAAELPGIRDALTTIEQQMLKPQQPAG